MKRVTNRLIILLLTVIAPALAMDVEPKREPIAQTSPLLQIPPEVLEHILTFVIANDPDAIGNLARIQEVCKGLAGLLSLDKMKGILELTQEDINHLLERTILPLPAAALPNPRRIQLLFNLGAKLNAYQIHSVIFHTISNANDYLQTRGTDHFVKSDALKKMFEVIEILEKHSATYDKINKSASLLTSTISSQFPAVAKFLLTHGMIPTQKSLVEAIILQKNPALTELILKAGIQPKPWHLAYAVENDLADITSMLLKAGAQPDPGVLIYAITERKNPNIIELLIEYGTDVNATGGFLADAEGRVSRRFTRPPLAYVKDAQVAKILLQAGAQIYLSCTETSGIAIFSTLILRAIEERNPAVLVEVLKQQYPFQTALAIATALMAGAPYISAVCTIL